MKRTRSQTKAAAEAAAALQAAKDSHDVQADQAKAVEPVAPELPLPQLLPPSIARTPSNPGSPPRTAPRRGRHSIRSAYRVVKVAPPEGEDGEDEDDEEEKPNEAEECIRAYMLTENRQAQMNMQRAHDGIMAAMRVFNEKIRSFNLDMALFSKEQKTYASLIAMYTEMMIKPELIKMKRITTRFENFIEQTVKVNAHFARYNKVFIEEQRVKDAAAAAKNGTIAVPSEAVGDADDDAADDDVSIFPPRQI